MSAVHKNQIFIDGANVAKEYGNGRCVSVVGLLRCAGYFCQREYPMKIILNRNLRTLAANGQLQDGDQLIKLENSTAGIIIYPPIGSDINEFFIQTAYDHGGIVISNDQYEKQRVSRKEWAHFLANRRLPFRFLNNDFVPEAPTIDGRVVEVDEFLRMPYQLGSDLSLAAALTNYLLTMKLDDSEDGTQRERRSSQRRIRRDEVAASEDLPRRRYKVGKITALTSDSATLEFSVTKDGNTISTIFNRECYHPNGRLVRDLSREFRHGDCVGFISVKQMERGQRKWKVVEVRKKSEMKRGYGRFKPLGEESTSGIIEARYKAEAGGGDVFFPGAALRDEGILLKDIPIGHWLYYYAFEQKPSAGCSAVAVEVFSATTAGVIVKKTQEHTYVWSLKTGLAVGEAVQFPEGTWVKFQFQQQTQRGRIQWKIRDVQMMPCPPGVTINAEPGDENSPKTIHMRCSGIAGIITDRYGSIWTEAFDVMTMPQVSLKNLLSVESAGLQPYQPIRIWAVYNHDHAVPRHQDSIGEEAAKSSTASASASRPSKQPITCIEPWRIMSVLAASGAAAAGAEPPYPPPSIIFGVEAIVLRFETGEEAIERGEHFILGSEKYGHMFATKHDLGNSQKLNVGDRVKASIVPQPLTYGDEYRALVVEKISSYMVPLPQGGENWQWQQI